MSQHLRVLKMARLVTDRQVGTRRIYSVDPEGVREVREYWESFWSQALAGFKAVADTEAEQQLAAQYNIRSIPTVMLFRGGQLVAQRAGASDARSLRDWISQNR